MENIPAIHAAKLGMRYPAFVLDVCQWGLTLYFDLTRLAPGRSPRVNARLFFEKTLAREAARMLGENARIEVVLIEVGQHPDNLTASLPADPAWLTWNNGTVRQLARRIRATGETVLMPVLADALEEAGCAEEGLLAHCREQLAEPNCWQVELLATQV